MTILTDRERRLIAILELKQLPWREKNNLPVKQFKTSSKKATVKFERNLKIETSLRTTLHQKATAMVMISPALSAA